MKYINKYNQFITEGFKSSEERAEELFGPSTNLEKQFSKVIVNHLCSDDDEECEQWATYNATLIELDDINSILRKEIAYRITDGEHPVKVLLNAINKVKPTTELLRLKTKISEWL